MKSVTLIVVAWAVLARAEQYDSRDRCFDELGCFPITNDFVHPIYRPINVAVDAREVIKTTFLIHTRENIQKADRLIGYEIRKTGFNNIHFNPQRETKFIVHGFLDNQFFGEWMVLLKNELLKIGDFNVIIVDWSGGNSLPYTQATANTRVVGAEMALLMQKLQAEFNVTLDSFHLYGHSLGAHIVGYAGMILKGQIARITALDTAEPYFQHMPKTVRLDVSDAQFVEAIHTDGRSFYTHLGLGFIDPVGHLDFYPNGGEVMPSCGIGDRIRDITSGGIRSISIAAACNHMMSTVYARDLIVQRNGCVPIGFRCPSYDMFKSGKCYDCGHDGSKCAPVTFNSMEYFKKFADPTKEVKMYFNTDKGNENFCLFHYNVQIKMRRFQQSNPHRAAPSVDGKYYLTLNGTNASESFTLDTHGTALHSGSTTSVLITTHKDIGEIKAISFRYEASTLFLPPRMELEYLKVTPMTALLPVKELKLITKTVCSANPLETRKEVVLLDKNC